MLQPLAAIALLLIGWASAKPTIGTAFRINNLTSSGGLPSTACGYGDVVPSGWPGQMAVGISASSPILTSGSLQACGACLRLTCDARQVTDLCKPGDVVVQVVDTCLTCAPADLNLHPDVFLRLAAQPELGTFPVSYDQVPCNPPGNIVVRLVEVRRSLGGYILLSLKSVAGLVVVAVDLAPAGQVPDVAPSATDGAANQTGNQWKPMENTWWGRSNTILGGALWSLSGLPGPGQALDMRLTSADAQRLIIRNAIPASAVPGDYPTNTQFRG